MEKSHRQELGGVELGNGIPLSDAIVYKKGGRPFPAGPRTGFRLISFPPPVKVHIQQVVQI